MSAAQPRSRESLFRPTQSTSLLHRAGVLAQGTRESLLQHVAFNSKTGEERAREAKTCAVRGHTGPKQHAKQRIERRNCTENQKNCSVMPKGNFR